MKLSFTCTEEQSIGGSARLLSLCDLSFKVVRHQAVESFMLFIRLNFINSDIP